MSDTCVPSIIVIGIAINQLVTKVSLKTICCLRLFVVVYKHVMLYSIKENSGCKMCTMYHCYQQYN